MIGRSHPRRVQPILGEALSDTLCSRSPSSQVGWLFYLALSMLCLPRLALEPRRMLKSQTAILLWKHQMKGK
jgi:hypothetical protein